MIRHGNKGELMSSLKGDTYDWHSSAFSSPRLQNGPYIHQDHCTNSGAQQSHQHLACIVWRGGLAKGESQGPATRILPMKRRYAPTMLMAATRAYRQGLSFLHLSFHGSSDTKLFHRSLKDPHEAGPNESPQMAVQIKAFLEILSAQQCKHLRKLKGFSIS